MSRIQVLILEEIASSLARIETYLTELVSRGPPPATASVSRGDRSAVGSSVEDRLERLEDSIMLLEKELEDTRIAAGQMRYEVAGQPTVSGQGSTTPEPSTSSQQPGGPTAPAPSHAGPCCACVTKTGN